MGPLVNYNIRATRLQTLLMMALTVKFTV